MTVTWFSDSNEPGTLTVDGIGESVSAPEPAEALTYGASEVEYIHGDVTEMWNRNQLLDGGKHYGFIEVDVRVLIER
ncbi:hypothetical protein MARI_09700 [Marinobacter sp. JH2]|nr:hypothetical protein MARI_09700 [Marinobacter sp. JH2]